ncbi:MAG: hypothetical protein WKF87_18135 [Chryseolinea sp.]
MVKPILNFKAELFLGIIKEVVCLKKPYAAVDVIDDVDGSYPASVGQRIAPKVHSPFLISF